MKGRGRSRHRPVPRWVPGLLAILALAAGCATGTTSAPPTGSAPPPPVPSSDTELPPGLGTLRQDDVTLTLRAGAVQIKVTPLEGSITLLTAPDTRERLSGLYRLHRTPLASRAGSEITLFLVSFFSDAPGEAFQPRDLSIVSSGVGWRAAAIQPMTPGWDRERLGQQETQMAVYAFPVILDFDQPFRVEYGGGFSVGWDRILPVVQRERARIRARGGG